MKITFKRKEYRTYEVLPEEEGVIKKALQQEGIEGFVKMLLESSVPFNLFEDEWELLGSDREILHDWMLEARKKK